MGFLNRILGRDNAADATACPHTSLVPHWDRPANMGKKDLAVYTCEACGHQFDYAQARTFLETPPPVLAGHAREPREHSLRR
jgi:hypothetical protein